MLMWIARQNNPIKKCKDFKHNRESSKILKTFQDLKQNALEVCCLSAGSKTKILKNAND